MPDLTALSPENIGISIGVCLAAIFVGVAKYLRERKAPAEQKTADVVVAGGTIADMTPVRGIERNTERMAAAAERIAKSIEAIREMLVDRAQDQEREAEILRRAEIMAQHMIGELQRPETPARARRHKPT